MTKFNLKEKTSNTVNFAGGEAYELSPKQQLISFMWNWFVEDGFYEAKEAGIEGFLNLLEQEPDKKFIAKLALYSRNILGMRSVSHLAASEIALKVKNETWTKDFFNSIVSRVDDMSEIIAAYKSRGGKRIPHSVAKGFAKAFDRFDYYKLAKYQGKNKEWKLLDIVNLIRPTPNEKNKQALKELIKNGKLKNTDTWESKLSLTGNLAESEEQKKQLKSEAWKELVTTKKIGYFALLKNLRNIIEQAPEIVPNVCELLIDEKRIENSKVLPFRFFSAYSEIKDLNSGATGIKEILLAISKALDISMKNVPTFEGTTAIILDVSGSMDSPISSKSKVRLLDIASLFSACIFKVNMKADIVLFSNDAEYIHLNPLDSTLSIMEAIKNKADGGGTNFHSIFPALTKQYNRVIILSDEQGWMGHKTPTKTYLDYKKKFDCYPTIYSFNLASYGTIQFPEKNVICLNGISEKTLELLSKLEIDKNSIMKEIEDIKIEISDN